MFSAKILRNSNTFLSRGRLRAISYHPIYTYSVIVEVVDFSPANAGEIFPREFRRNFPQRIQAREIFPGEFRRNFPRRIQAREIFPGEFRRNFPDVPTCYCRGGYNSGTCKYFFQKNSVFVRFFE